MSVEQLITAHLDIWTAAVSEKKSGRGRSSGSTGSVYGIKKLRELILELAVRGKLVPQDESDEPASELLKRIQIEKTNLLAEGKKKKDKPIASIFEDELSFLIPKGWEWTSVANLTLLITDGTHHTPKYQENGVPFISVKDIDGFTVSFDDCKYISQKEHEVINGRCNPERDDILLCRIGTLGRPTIVDTDKAFSLFVSVGLLKLPKSVKFSRYFQLALSSPLMYLQYAKIMAGGSHTNKLNLGDIPRLSVPIPPLAEQHRIVAKVDELMALCDQLENQHNNAAEAHDKLVTHLLGTLTQSQNAQDFNINWQRISEHFDTLFTTEASIDALKQTLLQLAVMGKLVPQDPNDEPASELLKRIKAEKAKLIAEGKIKKDKPLAEITDEEKPFELPVGWEWVRLAAIGFSSTGRTPSTQNSSLYNGPIPFIGPGQITLACELLPTDKWISEAGRKETTIAKTGDILMVCIGGSIGKSAIADKEMGFNQQINCISPLYIESKFAHISMMANSFQSKLLEFATGSATPIINKSKWEELLVPVPPLIEQHRIVIKVDELMAICGQLKFRLTEANLLQQKLADVMVEQAIS